MPLNPATLQSGILNHLQDPKKTISEAAQGWADAIEPYLLTIAPPSTGTSAGRQAFVSAMSANPSPTGLVSGLTAWAAAVGAGMTPPGTPPAAALDFTSFLSVPERSYEQAASELATLIDLWWRTGLTGTVPPIPWN